MLSAFNMNVDGRCKDTEAIVLNEIENRIFIKKLSVNLYQNCTQSPNDRLISIYSPQSAIGYPNN